MKPTILRDRATTADGRLMTLHEHDGGFAIRIDGVELMSSRQHHSEERLAELACAHVRERRAAARVLIGGLGLGFTLRAALGNLGPDAEVVVAEIMPAVIRWNRAAEYGLAADALADPRVAVVEGDVFDVIRQSRAGFDAIMLDIDNGADALTTAANGRLYEPTGLAAMRAAIRPGGCVAIWSAGEDPAFVERMRRCGWTVDVERARTHRGGGGKNCIFIGR